MHIYVKRHFKIIRLKKVLTKKMWQHMKLGNNVKIYVTCQKGTFAHKLLHSFNVL